MVSKTRETGKFDKLKGYDPKTGNRIITEDSKRTEFGMVNKAELDEKIKKGFLLLLGLGVPAAIALNVLVPLLK